MDNQFKHILEAFKSEILTKMEVNHREIKSKCDVIETQFTEFRQYVGTEITKLKTITVNHENRITAQEADIAESKNQINTLTEKLNIISIEKSKLDDIVDDQTNRSLRKTLIFRGIKEQHNESWAQTARQLAKLLSDINHEVNINDVLQDIDRAHQPAGNKRDNDICRPIFVQFTTWKNAQYYMDSLIRHNKQLKRNNQDTTVFVDQMYSQKLTSRRKSVAKLRMDMKDGGD